MFTSLKAIRRLYKEADSQKEILSSNREMNVKIPELMGDDELRAKLSWDDFEPWLKEVISWMD